MIAAPGLPGCERVDETASQVDVAPTVLAYLGLDVSNHFMGRNLLERTDHPPPVVSLRLGGVAVTWGDTRMHARLDDPRFLRKFEYTNPAELRAGALSPEFRHGLSLPVDAKDQAEMSNVLDAVRAYGYLVRANRLWPRDRRPVGTSGD